MEHSNFCLHIPHDVRFSPFYIPYADLVDMRKYAKPEALPEALLFQPALRAEFDTKRCQCSQDDPSVSFHRTLQYMHQPLLALCHQRGSDLFVAFADLKDPRMWPVLEQWHDTGTIAVVQTADSRPLTSYTMSFELDAATRKHAASVQEGTRYDDMLFSTVAGMYAWKHDVEEEFCSSIAQYPVLNSVNVSVVRPVITQAKGVYPPVVVRKSSTAPRRA